MSMSGFNGEESDELKIWDLLSSEQAQWGAMVLWKIAQVDGIDHREQALITALAGEAVGAESERRSLTELVRAGEAYLTSLPALREALLFTAFLVAYTDGVISTAEEEALKELTGVLQINAERSEAISHRAKTHLFRGLAAQLRNRDALKKIGLQLQLSEGEVEGFIEESRTPVS